MPGFTGSEYNVGETGTSINTSVSDNLDPIPDSTQNESDGEGIEDNIPYRPLFRRPFLYAGPINAGPNNADFKKRPYAV